MSNLANRHRSDEFASLSMSEFWDDQSEWSQLQFGGDDERGPRGPLLHLKKEIGECLDELPKALNEITGLPQKGNALPKLHAEIVDMQFLIFDAARRSGMTFRQLLIGCFHKMCVNKNRQWQKPTSDAPVEHVREDQGHKPRGPIGGN